jgi:MoaA/NifB/PqqE/SkfB family radical SAM enzyme
MSTIPKFRIDGASHNHLMNSDSQRPSGPADKGLTLPEPVYPRFPDKLLDPGPDTPPERRRWTVPQAYQSMKGWLFPYIRSRLLPGEFHPITAYLFVEYKCNLDCWYCWAFNNRVKGMTEDTARQAIDWLHGHGCRVLALMGGEPLLRPNFAHKVVYYAAQKGFWVYIGTNARLLRPDVADRLADAGASVFNVALDAWDQKPGLPKALLPIQPYLLRLLRKQYGYGYMVFLNINICRNNIDDVRQLTEWAHAHRIATDYHINETPMLEQDEHFKHLYDNPTYIRPEDWNRIDELIDWLVAKNNDGYQMVNSVERLQEIKAFMRMVGNGSELKKSGSSGTGYSNNSNGAAHYTLLQTRGIVRDSSGQLRFADWNCRAGQNNIVVRTDGTIAPCFPMYSSSFDWGNIDMPKLNPEQLSSTKKECQKHCFSTLNHTLAYCYDDARVIKYVWTQLFKNRLKGGARGFDV